MTEIAEAMMGIDMTTAETLTIIVKATRLNSISDQQLHNFALQLDDLRVGGDGGAGFAIAILLILVLFLMFMMFATYGGRRAYYRR